MATVARNAFLKKGLVLAAMMATFLYGKPTLPEQMRATRKIASIPRMTPTLNPTENMLASPHAPDLSGNPYAPSRASRLRFYGACKSSAGRTYMSGESGYGDCMTQSHLPSLNSSVGSFYDSTQRQAGAAILLHP